MTLADIPKAVVEVNKTSFQRAMHNLIENALRYGKTAHVSADRAEKKIHIYVDDEGPGIPVSKRDQVLKPFVRLETSRNRDTGGTGLGLSLAKILIMQQKGNLVLETSPADGLRATIELPLN